MRQSPNLSSVSNFYATNYRHDGNGPKGAKNIRFTPILPSAGSYEVFAWWTAGSNRAASVPIDIRTADGLFPMEVNQKLTGGVWVSLGIYTFNAGTSGSVLISNTGTSDYVIADAIRFDRKPQRLKLVGAYRN